MAGDAHGGGHGAADHGGGIGGKIIYWGVIILFVVFVFSYFMNTVRHEFGGGGPSVGDSSFVGTVGGGNAYRPLGPTPEQRAAEQHRFQTFSDACEEQAAKRRALGYDAQCKMTGGLGQPSTGHVEGGFQESGRL